MTHHHVLGAAARALCLAGTLSATQELVEFDFVSVRRAAASAAPVSIAPAAAGSTAPAGLLVLPDGRFEARGQTLEGLARVAFGLEGVGRVESRISWVSIDRFDITSSAGRPWSNPPHGTIVPAELRTMLRTLLEDRFALRARIETKKGDVTVIRLAKPEKLGPGLRRSTGDCRGPFTDVLPGEGTSRPPCPFTNTSERIQAEAVTMTEAARLIAQLPYMRPRAPLLDQTGLPDLYDVSFSLRRGRLSEDFLLAELEGQLGLKLHKTSMPLPTLIIGGAKKPRTD